MLWACRGSANRAHRNRLGKTLQQTRPASTWDWRSPYRPMRVHAAPQARPWRARRGRWGRGDLLVVVELPRLRSGAPRLGRVVPVLNQEGILGRAGNHGTRCATPPLLGMRPPPCCRQPASTGSAARRNQRAMPIVVPPSILASRPWDRGKILGSGTSQMRVSKRWVSASYGDSCCDSG